MEYIHYFTITFENHCKATTVCVGFNFCFHWDSNLAFFASHAFLPVPTLPQTNWREFHYDVAFPFQLLYMRHYNPLLIWNPSWL